MEVPLPADVPPQEPLYHCQVAPVPSDPPVKESVVLLPEQMVRAVAVAEAGAVEFPPALASSSKTMVFTLAVSAVPSKKAPPPGLVVGKSLLAE